VVGPSATSPTEGLSRERSNQEAMSVSTEVQRTLVKSPPELWAELGDAERLARHLGAIGEIRVTAVEPESRVEWEADGAIGTVALKQSGWGTRVTLTLTRELPPHDTSADEDRPEIEPASVGPEIESVAAQAQPEPTAIEAGPEPVAVEPQPEPVAAEPAPDIELPSPPKLPEGPTESSPKRRFFARLFKRRATAPVAPEPTPRLEVLAWPEQIYPDPPPKPAEPIEAAVNAEAAGAEPAADLSVELAELEAQLERDDAELLTGVLDRLGAAHHRPFSRA